jgi:hypothetical protein
MVVYLGKAQVLIGEEAELLQGIGDSDLPRLYLM